PRHRAGHARLVGFELVGIARSGGRLELGDLDLFADHGDHGHQKSSPGKPRSQLATLPMPKSARWSMMLALPGPRRRAPIPGCDPKTRRRGYSDKGIVGDIADSSARAAGIWAGWTPRRCIWSASQAWYSASRSSCMG